MRHKSSRRKRVRHKSRYKEGRILLLIIFAAYCAACFLPLYNLPALASRDRVLSSALISTLWMGALLGATWKHQNWARYLLAALLLLNIISFVIVIPFFLDVKDLLPLSYIFSVAFFVSVNIAALLLLMRHPAILRLLNHHSAEKKNATHGS